jgi:hypothetical protein
MPGAISLRVAALKYFTSAALPHRQSSERSERLYLKKTRSILGMVNTTCAVRPYIDLGYNLIAVGADTLFLGKSAQQTIKLLRG